MSAPGCADIVDLPALEVCIFHWMHCSWNSFHADVMKYYWHISGLRVRVRGFRGHEWVFMKRPCMFHSIYFSWYSLHADVPKNFCISKGWGFMKWLCMFHSIHCLWNSFPLDLMKYSCIFEGWGFRDYEAQMGCLWSGCVCFIRFTSHEIPHCCCYLENLDLWGLSF